MYVAKLKVVRGRFADKHHVPKKKKYAVLMTLSAGVDGQGWQ